MKVDVYNDGSDFDGGGLMFGGKVRLSFWHAFVVRTDYSHVDSTLLRDES